MARLEQESLQYNRYLGTYRALLDYAIDCLNNKTAFSHTETAERLEIRHNELISQIKNNTY
jgi:hypothetical protein